MEIRKLPAGRGLDWFKEAINLGSRNPKGIFGAALLMIVAFYVMTFVLVLPMVWLTEGATAPSPQNLMSRVLPLALVMMLAVGAVVPFLIGGLMHVIRENEAGRHAGALSVFMPFRSVHWKALVGIGLVSLLVQTGGALLALMVGGSEYFEQYMTMMREIMSGANPATIAQPETPLLMLVIQLVMNYFGYALLLFSVPSVLFKGMGVRGALGSSLRASLRNVAANVIAGVLLVAGLIAAMLVFALFALFVGFLAKLIHQVLASFLLMGLFLLFFAAIMVVAIGAAYIAWRDTFGDDVRSTPSATIDSIEV